MPLSSVTRVSDGIQKQYDFDFGYLRKSHIFVFVNNELRSFKWLGPFQIELLNFPQPDDTVTIRRLTDRVNRITTFTDGQTILAADLNAADLQTFYIAQEMLDQIEERILAGEVSVIGSGYITAQWIQEQLDANIAGSTQFQAISDALDNEALERANALAAEAAARAAEIAAEASARSASVFALEQADLEAGQRLDVLEADVNDATTGIKARIGTLETVTVDLENNKADASVVSAIQAAVDAAEAQIVDIDEALATETAARTSQINAANSRIDGAEATISGLQVTVTSLQTGKAEASELSALTARVDASEAAIVDESSARASGDSANATSINQLSAKTLGAKPNLMTRPVAVSKNGFVPAAGNGWFSSGGVTGNFGGLLDFYSDVFSQAVFLELWGSGFSTSEGRFHIYDLPDGGGATGGVPYTLSIWGGVENMTAGFYMFAKGASGNYLGECPVTYFEPTPGRKAVTWTTPSGTKSLSIVVYIPPQTVTGYVQFIFNSIKLEQGSQETAFNMEGAVTFLREALATGSSSLARLLLAVNTTNNVATIEAVAQEGSGVWNGSAITLQANLIKLLAQDIAFGSRTQFEDTRGTLYNTEAGKRLRILGPFGASNNLVLWYGPSSVALQAETTANGDFGIATDGKVYVGNSPLAPPMKLTASTPRTDIRTGGGSRGFSVTITPSGGRAPYTYSHELISYTSTSGTKPSINNTTSQTYGITAPASAAGTEIIVGVVSTVTDADGRQVQATFGGAMIWAA